jgi:hypothetical protein
MRNFDRLHSVPSSPGEDDGAEKPACHSAFFETALGIPFTVEPEHSGSFCSTHLPSSSFLTARSVSKSRIRPGQSRGAMATAMSWLLAVVIEGFAA